MSEIKNVGSTWLAKSNQLSFLPFEELTHNGARASLEFSVFVPCSDCYCARSSILISARIINEFERPVPRI